MSVWNDAGSIRASIANEAVRLDELSLFNEKTRASFPDREISANRVSVSIIIQQMRLSEKSRAHSKVVVI